MPQPLNIDHDGPDDIASSYCMIWPGKGLHDVPAQQPHPPRHTFACTQTSIGTVPHNFDWLESELVDYSHCCDADCAIQCSDSGDCGKPGICYNQNCNTYICDDSDCTGVACSNEPCSQYQCCDVPCFLSSCIDISGGCGVSHSEPYFCPEGSYHDFSPLSVESPFQDSVVSQNNAAHVGLPARFNQFINPPLWNDREDFDTNYPSVANDPLGNAPISTSPFASHRSLANTHVAPGLSLTWSGSPYGFGLHGTPSCDHSPEEASVLSYPKHVVTSFTPGDPSLQHHHLRLPATNSVGEDSGYKRLQHFPPETRPPSPLSENVARPEKKQSGPCTAACGPAAGSRSSSTRSAQIVSPAQQQLRGDEELGTDYTCKWVLNPDEAEPLWKVCNLRCHSAMELDEHLNEVHIKLKKKQHTCQWADCVRRTPGHDFKHKGKLRRHVQGAHSRSLKFSCRFCFMDFVTNDQRRNHETTHTGAKPHRCSICQHLSATITQHKTHMRTHTKERPYKCPYCSHTSGDSSNLSKHVKAKHAGRPRHLGKDSGVSDSDSRVDSSIPTDGL